MTSTTTVTGAALDERILREGYGPGAWHGPDLRAALAKPRDVEMKRRALEKCDTPETAPTPFYPTDEVLAFLESL